MRAYIATSIGALWLAAVLTGSADAQCQFPHPKQAKRLHLDLVQDFVPCGTDACSTPGNASNTFTENGIPACAPPETWSEDAGNANGWRFGPKGGGSVTIQASKQPPERAGGVFPDAVDARITLRLKDVQDASGPVDGFGHLTATARITFDNRELGDMTVHDLPMHFANFQIVDGRATVKTSVDAAWLGWAQPPLPACTSLAIANLRVEDADGLSFASPGVYLP